MRLPIGSAFLKNFATNARLTIDHRELAGAVAVGERAAVDDRRT